MAKRQPTKYPGVFFIESVRADGKAEKTYYILYRKNGKLIEEPVGKQYKDDMTPAKASLVRTRRIEGDELSNTEKRTVGKTVGKTLDVIFEEYVNYKNHKPSTRQPENVEFLKQASDFDQKQLREKSDKKMWLRTIWEKANK